MACCSFEGANKVIFVAAYGKPCKQSPGRPLCLILYVDNEERYDDKQEKLQQLAGEWRAQLYPAINAAAQVVRPETLD
uniref:Uncharacterized protein n=1 Tax=Trichuris muris TaxID=70415 RepID=A0A5S6PZX6_TRIMR